MKIALAQIRPKKGDIGLNVQSHLRFIDKALAQNCDAIFFPELSLTGYEPELAKDLGVSIDDFRLDVFQEKSDLFNITIAVGVPTRMHDNRLLSKIAFQPNIDRQVYSKQLLHDDELPYFIPGSEQQYLVVNGITIATAICYESLQSQHLTNCLQEPFDIYLACVAKPERALDNAQKHYSGIAKEFQKPILMVNSVGPCDNFVAGGRTAFWDINGNLGNQLDSETEGLLVYSPEQ